MNPEDFASAFDEHVDNALMWLSDNAAGLFDLFNDLLKALYQAVYTVLEVPPFMLWHCCSPCWHGAWQGGAFRWVPF